MMEELREREREGSPDDSRDYFREQRINQGKGLFRHRKLFIETLNNGPPFEAVEQGVSVPADDFG